MRAGIELGDRAGACFATPWIPVDDKPRLALRSLLSIGDLQSRCAAEVMEHRTRRVQLRLLAEVASEHGAAGDIAHPIRRRESKAACIHDFRQAQERRVFADDVLSRGGSGHSMANRSLQPGRATLRPAENKHTDLMSGVTL